MSFQGSKQLSGPHLPQRDLPLNLRGEQGTIGGKYHQSSPFQCPNLLSGATSHSLTPSSIDPESDRDACRAWLISRGRSDLDGWRLPLCNRDSWIEVGMHRQGPPFFVCRHPTPPTR